MKKIISLIIILTMLLSALGVGSYAKITIPFTDTPEDMWYYDALKYCYGNSIVKGMTETTFEPSGILTRAQFVMMLGNKIGYAETAYYDRDSGFEDVKPGHWYNGVVCWAVNKGYIKGVSATRFAPNEPVTREQAARILYLCAEDYTGDFFTTDITLRADLSEYDDDNKISDWAYEQMQWAVAANIIHGTNATTLDPRGQTTRAQACRLMYAFNDHMNYGGPRDTEGAFKILADHVMQKSPDGTSKYSYYSPETEDDIHYYVRYDEAEKDICFMYSHDVWYSGFDSPQKNYEYNCMLDITGLQSTYEISLHYQEFFTNRFGLVTYTLTPDGYTVTDYFLESDGYENADPETTVTEETLLATADADVAKLLEFVNEILAECDLEIYDLFTLPEITE